MSEFYDLPTISDVEAAAARLAGLAVETPLVLSPTLDERVGGRVLIKAETLQRTGSFKFRGAYNRIAMIPPEDRRRGVVACSSGNHAQGVAAAAKLFGIAATIVMPHDAPALKRARTIADGAEIVGYDRLSEDREAIALGIARERGATFVAPYDDALVIAGQGTVGLEIAEQATALGVIPDQVLVPTSGGGLVAGTGLAIRDRLPSTTVHSVEPSGFDDHARSLRSGRWERNAGLGGSICDALLAPEPGRLTFAINRRQVASGYVVDDDAVLAAIAFAFTELKLVVEPGGAVALAAILSGQADVASRTTVVVLSGGNIDAATLSLALAAV